MAKAKKLSPTANTAFGKGANTVTLGISAAKLHDIVTNKTMQIDFGLLDTPYAGLSDANKRALAHLVKAATYLDNAFLQQDHPDNLRVRQVLEAAANDNPVAAEALTLFTMHNGVEGSDMYAKKSKPLTVFTGLKLQPGKGFYPQDLTQKELAAYIIAHPEQASALLGNNTIVRRDGDRLVAVPFSVAFRTEMEGAARELLAAAKETDHAGLAAYLRWQAQALVNDSDAEMTYNADKTWIALEDSPLEFTIGRENYEDGLSAAVATDPAVQHILEENGIKAKSKDSIGVRVGIVNQDSIAAIADYRRRLADVAAAMPLKEKYADQADAAGGKMTFADVDLVAIAGDYAAVRGGLTIAQNLPNSDKLAVQEKEGSRLVFHRQVRQSGAQAPEVLAALVDAAQVKWYDPNAQFLFTVGHELGHSLGPTKTADGRDKKTSLGALGGILEENKADMTSIFMTGLFQASGKFTAEEANKIFLTWAVGDLPAKQPGPEEAHRSRSVMQHNYFREKGAIKLDKGGKLSVVPEKMAETARQMLAEIVQLQLDGDAAKAQAFVTKYAAWNETLQYVADTKMSFKPKLYRRVNQPLKAKLLAP